MNTDKQLTTIGRAEKIFLPDFGMGPLPAKVDTGADISSIWATDISGTEEGLEFTPFGPSSPYFTNRRIVIPQKQYRVTRIANSFGEREMRYVVKLRVKIANRTIRATFSLANRRGKLYPILLGRRFLKGKFVVDVSLGDPLRQEEKLRRNKMRIELEDMGGKLEKQI